MTHPEAPCQFQGWPSKTKKVDGVPVPGNRHPFPKTVGIILLSLACEVTQPLKANHTTFWDPTRPLPQPTLFVCGVCCPQGYSCLLRWPRLCGVCFSLNKSTSYLSLCFSPTFVCNETSRTWVSLGPENRYVIAVGRLSFGWAQVPMHGFKSNLK